MAFLRSTVNALLLGSKIMRIPAIALSAFFLALNLACGPTESSSSDLAAKKKPTLLDEEALKQLADSQHFPLAPDENLTPGVRCKKPDELRYPEEIAYCERSVSTSLKNRVIREYDSELGFEIQHIARNKIKIDHYIPLCMGGDNDKTNLWPQHESVYLHTDPLETQLCLALSRGLITQNEAIDDMLAGKAHTDTVASLLEKVKNILH